jgi:hypothetical protein
MSLIFTRERIRTKSLSRAAIGNVTDEANAELLRTWAGARSCSALEQMERPRNICILPTDIENLEIEMSADLKHGISTTNEG